MVADDRSRVRAAARRRMAETGEPYAAARRKVIDEHQATPGEKPGTGARWFPISSIRSVTRSAEHVHGTTGVHINRGRLLVNGSTDNLVELAVEPPCHTSRTLATMYTRQRVNRLILSLADPDGFIAAVQRDGSHS
jgi:hypothetical protein